MRYFNLIHFNDSSRFNDFILHLPAYVRYANEMNLHESLDTIFQPSLGTMRKINSVHGSVSKVLICVCLWEINGGVEND